jgi:hypothetical protein
MRRREVLKTSGLMPVAAAVALVSEGQGEPSQPPVDAAKLRADLIALRADVELLELEHEANRAALLDLLKALRQVEMTSVVIEATARPGSTLVAEPEAPGLAGMIKVVEVDKKANEALRAYTDRKKVEFIRSSKELHEKKMSLADAEARYAARK